MGRAPNRIVIAGRICNHFESLNPTSSPKNVRNSYGLVRGLRGTRFAPASAVRRPQCPGMLRSKLSLRQVARTRTLTSTWKAAWLTRIAQLQYCRRNGPVLSRVEGPAPSQVEGPVLSLAERRLVPTLNQLCRRESLPCPRAAPGEPRLVATVARSLRSRNETAPREVTGLRRAPSITTSSGTSGMAYSR